MDIGTLHQTDAGRPIGEIHAVDQWGLALCGARIGYTFTWPRFSATLHTACRACALRAY